MERGQEVLWQLRGNVDTMAMYKCYLDVVCGHHCTYIYYFLGRILSSLSAFNIAFPIISINAYTGRSMSAAESVGAGNKGPLLFSVRATGSLAVVFVLQ